jgi:hypothetical protein
MAGARVRAPTGGRPAAPARRTGGPPIRLPPAGVIRTGTGGQAAKSAARSRPARQHVVGRPGEVWPRAARPWAALGWVALGWVALGWVALGWAATGAAACRAAAR